MIFPTLRRVNLVKNPRRCGLFSLAAWAPSVPTGSSRWPTTVVVLASANNHPRRRRRYPRRPVPPLGRALFSLATSTTRRWPKLFSLAKHDRTLRYRRPTRPAHLLATFGLLFTLAWATCLKPSDNIPPNSRRPRRCRRRRIPSTCVSCRRTFPCCGWTIVFGIFGKRKRSTSRGTLPGVLGWGVQAQDKRPPGSVSQLGQYWKQKQNP